MSTCNCAARLAGRVDGNAHFEGCPHFVPPNAALRRALGDIISQTVVAERMGYTDPQDWQEKFQRVRQIARDALGVAPTHEPDKGKAWAEWREHPQFAKASAQTHFDAGWVRAAGVAVDRHQTFCTPTEPRK